MPKKKEPKKYIINPEWLEKHSQDRGQIIKRMHQQNAFIYKDEPNEYLPDKWYETAQWIMIKETPNCEIKVPKLSIWLAIPDESDKIIWEGVPKKYWKIFTPLGELRLHLREVSMVKIENYVDFIGKDYELKFLHENPQITDQIIKDRIFYIRSRGVDKIDAYKYILGDLQDPQLFYLVANVEYQKMFCRPWEFVAPDVMDMKDRNSTAKRIPDTEWFYWEGVTK